MPDFVITFIRFDGQPNEEYWYSSVDEAKAHWDLFRGDDSGLYRRIEVTQYSTGETLYCMDFDKGVA